MSRKQKIYDHYIQFLTNRIESIQQELADLKETGANETKSTAGDKHETALAMIQIEQAKTRDRLSEILAQKASLEKIDPASVSSMIRTGSLVQTNKGLLFVSVAVGKVMVDNNTVIAISPQSPLGQQLMGLAAGDTTTVNNQQFMIEAVE